MGTHGTSGFNELFLGSNAQRVVTLSDIPVLTMQSKLKHSGFKNILIPIDNSLHSREKVNMAILIADVYGAILHIIGLLDSDDIEVLNKINIKIESIKKIMSNDKLPYKTTIVHGKSLAKDAMKYAEENNCDLIVINTGHESKLTGIFLGAFAQQIVNHSKIPVLSIKHAEGYFSIETSGFGI
jgi:nucleotide-binding universal stress UspA family protein